PDDRVLRSASEAGGAVDIAFLQSSVDLIQLVRVAPGTFDRPPEHSFENRRDGDDEHSQEWIHDRAAPEEGLENRVTFRPIRYEMLPGLLSFRSQQGSELS